MNHLVLLLRLRLRAARNAVRFARPAHRWLGLGLSGGSLVFFVGIFLLSLALLAGAEGVGGAPARDHLIERGTQYLFLFLLAGAVPFVSATLLAPGDLPLLRATPARPWAIVAARLLDAAFVSSAQFIVIGVPLLFASAAALRLGVWGWAAFFALLLLFLLLPPFLVAALLLLIARVVGTRRLRAAVALLSAILAVGMCLLLVGEFAREAGRAVSRNLALSASALGEGAPPPAWLPSRWMSDALLALGSPGGSPLAPAALLLAVTALSGALALGAGRGVLLDESLLEGEGTGVRRGGESALESLLRACRLSSPLRALVAKDARTVARDLVLLSQIGVPVILYLVPFVIAGQIRGMGIGRWELFLLSASMVATIAYMETSILSLSSIGLEGRAFWTILHAPVSVETFVRAKFLTAFGGSVLLCAPLLLFSCLVFAVGVAGTLAGLGLLLVACAALCGLGVGIAGLFPRFIYENPAHRASLSALIAGFVGATAYVIASGVILGGGLFLASRWPERNAPIVGVALVLFCLLSLLTGLLPLLLACRRLDGYAWEE